MILKNKNIIVTGASSGIGEALTKELVRQGAHPLLLARRGKELARVQKEIFSIYNTRVEYLDLDLNLKDSYLKIIEYFQSLNKNLDGIVHNAGITTHGHFEDTQFDVLQKTMQINFYTPVLLTQALLPLLKKNYNTKFIALVSTPSGLHGIPLRFAYSASKAAAQAFMECIAVEWKDYNVETFIFYPGYTRTNLRLSGLNAVDGSILKEKQEKNAKDANTVARELVKSIRKNKKFTFLEKNGFFIYWLRTLAPNILEKILYKKYKKEKGH